MTVGVEFPTVEYVAFGATGPFDFTFIIGSGLDLNVYLDGVFQPSNQYSVDVNADQDLDPGGSIFFLGPVYAPTVVTIDRNTVVDQQVDYTPYDAFPAETHEGALDKLTIIAQDHEVELSRSIKVKPNDDGTTDYTFPDYDSGKGLMWHEATKLLTNSNDKFNDIVSDAAASAAAAASSASNAAFSASDAANSATNAGNSAFAANTSAVNALSSENKANLWAEELEDVEVEPGEFSAMHWAKKAEDVSGLDARYLRKDVDDVTVGDILIDKTSPTLTLNDTSGNSNTSLVFNGNNIIDGLLAYSTGSNALVLIAYQAGAQVVRLELTSAGKMNLQQGVFQIGGVDVNLSKYLRNDIDDVTVGNLKISKNNPIMIIDAIDSSSQTLSFRKLDVENSVVQNIGITKLVIRKYDTNLINVAEITLDNNGSIDISKGLFKINGVDINNIYLRKDIGGTLAGNLLIDKTSPTLTLNDTTGNSNTSIAFNGNNVIDGLIAYSTGSNALVLIAYQAGAQAVRLELTSAGKMNLKQGVFQIGGVDVNFPTNYALGFWLDGDPAEWGSGITVVKTATGFYTCTFITPMPDTNYAVFLTTVQIFQFPVFVAISSRTINEFRVEAYNDTGASVDVGFYYKVERAV